MTTIALNSPQHDRLERLVSLARLIVSQLSRLERRHRAGIEPDFGELQDLFETKTFVERLLGDDEDTNAPLPAIARCPIPGCQDKKVRPGVEGGRLLCDKHASEAEALLGRRR